MKMIPGMNKIDDGMLKQGEQQLKRIEAMIGSMTEAERQRPELLASQPSRRRRIAAGSGHSPADVDKVLGDFQTMRGFMQQMSRGGIPGMGIPGMGMPGMGMPGMGGGMPGMGAKGRSGAAGGPRPAKPKKNRKGFGDL
jgi:signal recognition particle subunit SRP54